jgi:cyclic pyranopterin phosphate synthase
MAKRNDRGMEVTSVRLVHKSGGRSGVWNRTDEAPQPRANQPLMPPTGRRKAHR